MASGSGWNLWVWLVGVVVRRYINFLILLIPTFCSVFFMFLFFINKYIFIQRKSGPLKALKSSLRSQLIDSIWYTAHLNDNSKYV